ncbi:MAG: hypothetical protein ACE10C_12170 [Candidatus Binatia bacterium]
MKDKKYLNHLKTPTVAPLGSFFCPEPQLDYGLSHMHGKGSGVTPWNSSSNETEIIDIEVIQRGEYFDLSARAAPKVTLMPPWYGVCLWKD